MLAHQNAYYAQDNASIIIVLVPNAVLCTYISDPLPFTLELLEELNQCMVPAQQGTNTLTLMQRTQKCSDSTMCTKCRGPTIMMPHPYRRHVHTSTLGLQAYLSPLVPGSTVEVAAWPTLCYTSTALMRPNSAETAVCSCTPVSCTC